MIHRVMQAYARLLRRLSNLLSARSLFSHREQCIEDAARDGPCAHGNFAGTSGGRARRALVSGQWSE